MRGMRVLTTTRLPRLLTPCRQRTYNNAVFIDSISAKRQNFTMAIFCRDARIFTYSLNIFPPSKVSAWYWENNKRRYTTPHQPAQLTEVIYHSGNVLGNGAVPVLNTSYSPIRVDCLEFEIVRLTCIRERQVVAKPRYAIYGLNPNVLICLLLNLGSKFKLQPPFKLRALSGRQVHNFQVLVQDSTNPGPHFVRQVHTRNFITKRSHPLSQKKPAPCGAGVHMEKRRRYLTG